MISQQLSLLNTQLLSPLDASVHHKHLLFPEHGRHARIPHYCVQNANILNPQSHLNYDGL